MYIISISGGKPIRTDELKKTTGRCQFTRIWKDGTKENFDVPMATCSISEIEGKSVDEYWQEVNEMRRESAE